MVNFFIGLGVVAGILALISLAGYRIFTGKATEEREKKATKEREDIKTEVSTSKDSLSNQMKKSDSLLLDKIENSKDEVISKQNDIQKRSRKDREASTKKIIDRIDKASEDQNKNQEEIIEKLDELKNPPKDPNGLYRDDKKWGIVKNFNVNDDGVTFTIEKIEFDNPIRDRNELWIPFHYQEYLIKFQKIESLVSMFPPGAEGLEGIILNKNE